MTKRIKLVVGYDGTDFSGWAAQKDRRTVQRTLTEFVRQVSGDACEIVGASRTDSGAHAKGQVCHFDTTSPIEPTKWAQILNQLLPRDLSILRSEQVDRKFHARFSADWRHYRYRITHVRDPLAMRTAHWYWKKLDAKLMHETGQILVGSRDFRAFSEELEPNQTTIRELQSLTVRAVRHEVWIDIVGNAFVRGMMRRISGGLSEVGRGYRSVEDFQKLIDPVQRETIQWPVVLPANGLTLHTITYGRWPNDHRERNSPDQEIES